MSLSTLVSSLYQAIYPPEVSLTETTAISNPQMMVDPLRPGTLACASALFYKTTTKIPLASRATSAPYSLQHHCHVIILAHLQLNLLQHSSRSVHAIHYSFRCFFTGYPRSDYLDRHRLRLPPSFAKKGTHCFEITKQREGRHGPCLPTAPWPSQERDRQGRDQLEWRLDRPRFNESPRS